jgi:hypothetical protein
MCVSLSFYFSFSESDILICILLKSEGVCSSKFICWSIITHVMVCGGWAFVWQWGPESGLLWVGISALVQKTQKGWRCGRILASKYTALSSNPRNTRQTERKRENSCLLPPLCEYIIQVAGLHQMLTQPSRPWSS